MILVVGATGLLGSAITRRLLADGAAVRTLVRSGSAHGELVAAGASAAVGDLKDPESVRSACRGGVDAIITTANAIGRIGADNLESVDHLGNRTLIDAAVGAGVRKFVFVSALGADSRNPMPLLRIKGLTEEHLRAAGLDWTVLQPNFYMDTWIPAIVGGPVLAGQPVTLAGDGQRRHSMIAIADVVAFAVAALRDPQASCRTLFLGGPEPVTWRDTVAAFERETGRDIAVRTVAPGEAIPAVPEFVSQLAAALDGYDSPLDMTDLAASFGITQTSLDVFVRGFLGAAQQRAGIS